MVRLNFISLIHAEVGQQETITLDLDTLKIDDLHLAYLRGDLQLTRVADGVLAAGNLSLNRLCLSWKMLLLFPAQM